MGTNVLGMLTTNEMNDFTFPRPTFHNRYIVTFCNCMLGMIGPKKDEKQCNNTLYDFENDEKIFNVTYIYIFFT